MAATKRMRAGWGLAWAGCEVLALCVPLRAWAAPRAPSLPPRVAPAPRSEPTSPREAVAAKSPKGAAGVSEPRPTSEGAPGRKALQGAQLAQARKLWYRGVRAFRKGRFEAARRAFQDCYRLSPRTDVLRNLSLSELRSGHPVEAAGHLRQLLQTPDALEGAARADAEKLLDEAKAQVGELKFTVDLDGAQVSVDGQAIGTSPLANRFVKPGARSVRIFKPGYPAAEREVVAHKGSVVEIKVHLKSHQSIGNRATLDPVGSAATARTETHAAMLMRADSPRSGMSGGETTVLVSLAALALGGAATGFLLSERADSREAEAAELRGRIRPLGCLPESEVTEDCATLGRLLGEREDSRRWARAGYIGAGVTGALALGYGLWLALRSPERTAEPLGGQSAEGEEGWASLRVRVAPTLGARGRATALGRSASSELPCIGGCLSVAGRF